MFRKDFTFTKRTLGYFCLLVGIVGFLAILGIDVLQAGREGGIGPAQRVALALMILTAVLGITLIPLGDDPA